MLKPFGKTYKTDKLKLAYHSSLTIEEGNKLIGKTIDRVEADKHHLVLHFTDGCRFMVKGFTVNEEMEIDSLDTKLEEKKRMI